MDNNNQILEALGKVPGLVEAAEKILEACEEFKKMLAELLNHQIHADIPTEELKKVGATVEQVVMQTRCAMPDTTGLAQQVAEKAIPSIRPAIRAEAELGVKDAIKDNPVQHIFTYAKTWDLVKVAETKLKRRIWAVLIINIILLATLIPLGTEHFLSKAQVGKEYMSVYLSEFTTKEERKILSENIMTISALPREYNKTPKLVRQRIKRNKKILKQRKAEAKANKGKYSTKIQLER